MPVLTQLNSGTMYLICGAIVLFVAAVCAVFIVRAWRAGKALGMDTARMKRAMTASATFTVLPSVGILLGVIALSGSLGIPWPWLRLSVIGALHYETQVAQAAAEQLGLQLSGETMTAGAFSTIALLMSVCIMWGMILSTLFNKHANFFYNLFILESCGREEDFVSSTIFIFREITNRLHWKASHSKIIFYVIFTLRIKRNINL